MIQFFKQIAAASGAAATALQNGKIKNKVRNLYTLMRTGADLKHNPDHRCSNSLAKVFESAA